MNRENLTKLVDGLTGLLDQPEEVKHFSMAVWTLRESCGTFGCAIGTAALKGWIRGLTLWQSAPAFHERGEERIPNKVGWHAVQAAFDLSYDEARWLFGYSAYSDNFPHNGRGAILAVTKRISDVLAEGFPTITSAMLKAFPLPQIKSTSRYRLGER